MKNQKYIVGGLVIFIMVLMTSMAFAGRHHMKPFVPDLSPGWNEIDPAAVYPNFDYNGLTPACSNCPSCDSDKYTFFAKRGTTNKLVVFFQGGGACWDSMNCLYYSTFNEQEFETVEGYFSNPDDMKGIFDTNNPDNPFKDWYIVYLPYCTGDLFWGANDFAYPDYTDALTVDTWTIQHRGFVNFKVVLKWMKDNFRLPREIFVAGSSAGGYGAIMNYPYIRESFPLSRVYVLGDAANGVTGGEFNSKIKDVWDVQMPDWILGSDISQITTEDVYTNIAAEYPFMKLAQYTTAWDQTQVWFYHLQCDDNVMYPNTWNSLGDTDFGTWNYCMNLYTHDAAAVAPNYRYYIGAGSDHTILLSDKFYTETSAGGVSFAQWIKSMVNNPFGVFGGPFQGIWQNLEAQ